MKNLVKSLYFLCTLLLLNCGNDPMDDLTGGDNKPSGKDIVVIVSSDGTVSKGHTFYAVNAKNFYIDNIKYKIVGGHLEVTDYDQQDFDGKATIIRALQYDDQTYEVLAIDEDAFFGCKTLVSVTFPSSLESIGEKAFFNCESLVSVILPKSLKSIGDAAFACCCDLESISLPNSVTHIGEGAFESCFSLTSITIPNSITNIGEGAFNGCTGITSMKVDSKNINYRSEGNCIIERETNTLVAGCKTSTIPNSITNIGDYAFTDCESLTSATIPSSVTDIGDYAFYGCSELSSVTSLATTPPVLNYRAFLNIASGATLHVLPRCKKVYAESKWGAYFQTIIEDARK